MRVRACLLVAAAVAAVGLPATSSAAPALETQSVPTLERAVLAKVNRLRVRRGFRPLLPSRALKGAARTSGARMLAGGYFDHRGIRHVSGMSVVGENLAWGAGRISADRVLALWLQSRPHRRNLLSPVWTRIGIGAVYGPGSGVYGSGPATVIVADFGAP